MRQAAWVPDSRTIGVASSQGIYLYDAQTLEELEFWRAKASIGSVSFSSDGQTLASRSGDTTVKVWDVASGREPRSLSGHGAEVLSEAFAPGGAALRSGALSGHGALRLWAVLLERVSFQAVGRPGGNSDGELLAACCESRHELGCGLVGR